MKVLIINPINRDLEMLELAMYRGRIQSIGPDWDLLCLSAYIKERTRHQSVFVDLNLTDNVELALQQCMEADRDIRVAVVRASLENLGSAMAVMQVLKKQFSGITTALCGSFPSTCAEHVMRFDVIDYALMGDPEAPLRYLLDYHDVPQRLVNVQGLLSRSSRGWAPLWEESLHSMALPDWAEIDWSGYMKAKRQSGQICVHARLSRGHTGESVDRDFSGKGTPLRIWPMNRMACCLQKCIGTGMTEVFFDDAPGVWTPKRLSDWIDALLMIRNTQRWGLQVFPRYLSFETIKKLMDAGCRRVAFLFPSTMPERLNDYGFVYAEEPFKEMIRTMQSLGILTELVFWVGGPEVNGHEAQQIIKFIRRLQYHNPVICAYPFHYDSPLADDLRLSHPECSDQQVIDWALNPWTMAKPVHIWGGKEQVVVTRHKMDKIFSSTVRDPRKIMRDLVHSFNGGRVIHTIEQKTMDFFVPRPVNPND
ncbi:MAG: hypothetical protein EOL87_11040 [Spartobacteria bacterium]|nr:hypothetical protein [Spartobacteria bacterium]